MFLCVWLLSVVCCVLFSGLLFVVRCLLCDANFRLIGVYVSVAIYVLFVVLAFKYEFHHVAFLVCLMLFVVSVVLLCCCWLSFLCF